jgi:hypothetical protein
MTGMKRTFPELQGWTFEIDEVSPGVYEVRGVDEAGRSVEATGTDPGPLLESCRRSAEEIRANRNR